MIIRQSCLSRRSAVFGWFGDEKPQTAESTGALHDFIGRGAAQRQGRLRRELDLTSLITQIPLNMEVISP